MFAELPVCVRRLRTAEKWRPCPSGQYRMTMTWLRPGCWLGGPCRQEGVPLEKTRKSLFPSWAIAFSLFCQTSVTHLLSSHSPGSFNLSSITKNGCFWTVVLDKTLESPLDCKEIQPVHPKGDQCWIFIGRTDAEAETPILWPLDGKNWLTWKDPDSGKDWRWEEKGTTEDEMIGWHHRLYGHEFEKTQGVSWWWTGMPGVLQSMGLQRVGFNSVTELNWLPSFSPKQALLRSSVISRLLDWRHHPTYLLAPSRKPPASGTPPPPFPSCLLSHSCLLLLYLRFSLKCWLRSSSLSCTTYSQSQGHPPCPRSCLCHLEGHHQGLQKETMKKNMYVYTAETKTALQTNFNKIKL